MEANARRGQPERASRAPSRRAGNARLQYIAGRAQHTMPLQEQKYSTGRVIEHKKPSTHAEHELVIPFEQLRSVVIRLQDEMQKVCAAWDTKGSMNKNWELLFKRLDADFSGRLDYAEFVKAVREGLRLDTSDKELQALWTYIDHDKSGEVSLAEFQHGLYLLILEGWEQITDDDLERVVLTLNAAGKKWYHGHFSWYKIFKAIDTDENDRLEYDELERVVRANGSQGGLSLVPEKVADADLRGLWRRLDDDCSGGVSVEEFVGFMRREEAELPEVELTQDELTREEMRAAAEQRAEEARRAHERWLEEQGIEPKQKYATGRVIENQKPSTHEEHELVLPFEQLRGVVIRLHDTMQRVCATWDSKGSMDKNWRTLFERIDADFSGRLDYLEFLKAVRDELKVPDTTEEELKALWTYIDHDKSGEVTIAEFQHGLYLLILEGWAPLMDEALGNLILTINVAAKKWYHGHFSWYKVFRAIDTDENDRLEFDEFERVIRANGSQGGLSLKPHEASLEALQGLWRRLDADCSGGVSIDEFMHFMRIEEAALPEVELTADEKLQVEMREAAEQQAREARQAAERRLAGHAEPKQKYATGRTIEHKRPTTHAVHRLLMPFEQLRAVVLRLQDQMMKVCAAWDTKGSMNKNWELLFKRLDKDFSGRLDFVEFVKAVREELLLPDMKDTDLQALWAYVDHDRSGEVTIAELQHGLYLLILEGWAPLTDEGLEEVVGILNTAGKKWYHGHFSWYKVFKAIDTDENDRLEYDEFERVIRANGSQGGLSLKPNELATSKIQGLWRRLDEDCSGGVSVEEFVGFMRLGEAELPEAEKTAEELTQAELQEIAEKRALEARQAAERRLSGLDDEPKQKYATGRKIEHIKPTTHAEHECVLPFEQLRAVVIRLQETMTKVRNRRLTLVDTQGHDIHDIYIYIHTHTRTCTRYIYAYIYLYQTITLRTGLRVLGQQGVHEQKLGDPLQAHRRRLQRPPRLPRVRQGRAGRAQSARHDGRGT